jgi:membrane protease YdiL (CAAX protease family)
MTINTPSQWTRLVAGVASVFALFHWAAQALGSDRGQAGILIGLLVVTATVVVEGVIFRQPPGLAARSLGLGRPRAGGLITAAAVCVVLLLVVPVFAKLTADSPTFLPGWLSLLPGLFAQAGVAEEVLFRGYLFARLRQGRSFWRAAGLSILPFAGVHLVLFSTMPWPIALAALLLSIVVSVPLAHLFKLGGDTIWAPALVHFVVQGTVKVITFTDATGSGFNLLWMAASAFVPMFALLIPRAER